MKLISIDKSFFYNIKSDCELVEKKLWVLDNEFNVVYNDEFNNLIIYENLSTIKSKISFYSELLKTFIKENEINLVFYKITHGGYFMLEILTQLINVNFNNLKIYIKEFNEETLQCFEKNLDFYKKNEWKNKIDINTFNNILDSNLTFHFYPSEEIFLENNIYIKNDLKDVNNFYAYNLKHQDEFLYIPNSINEIFVNNFYYFLKGNEVYFKGLIHFTMIVKNAGNILENVLNNNLEYIDQWTILDTGSTDNTVDIIKKVLFGKKKGKLYFEPFKDFKQSRNLCLDLAKKENFSEFFVMLDDTYVIEGPLIVFLDITRGDQFADSFSLYIKSGDTEYVTNRITRANRNLRYIYRIHEVIQEKNNKNVIIPIEYGRINDIRSDYMENRTMNRKNFDLELLFKEIEDNPNDPRAYYYIGQTYNLLEKYELAYEYFLKRANHPVNGFLQEKIDAIFEAGRIANFKLNKPWNECKRLYEWSYMLDKSRPDSLYFIGIHHYLENDFSTAFTYFKEAYHLGYPLHSQYSLKPTLSFYYCPKFLGELCYQMNEFKLGEEVCHFFLQKNNPSDDYYNIMKDWYFIYNKLNMRTEISSSPIKFNNDLFIFVVDGGFKSWNGSSIEKEGVGGSETWVIETAKYIKKNTDYHVIVFCNTPKNTVDFYENVEYRPLNDFFNICMNYEIKHCIISRFSEYIPVAIHSYIQNIYFIMHDLGPSGLIIPIHPKIKKIFCLTEWHKCYFLERFPQFIDITEVCMYGIDVNKFTYDQKIKNSFIYSSYPNRGLLQLLQMWSKIIEKYPNAILNIYSDVDNKWSNDNYPEMMINIKELLEKLKKDSSMNINYYGWVDKKTLYSAWSKAEYWLYPCIFTETFCLTALEAAASKTLAITNDLGALVNTVGNRGVLCEGDATCVEWQNKVLEKLFYYMDSKNKDEKELLINKNYEFVKNNDWNNRTQDLLRRIMIKDIIDIIHTIKKEKFNDDEYHILKIGAYKGNVPNDCLYNNIDHKMKIIFIEPIVSYFYELKENYNKKYENNSFIYLNEAISNTNEKITLYFPSKSNNFNKLPWWIEQLASVDKLHFKNHGYDIDLDTMNLYTITINQIIDKFNVNRLELLIIDTEGYDFKILMSLDFNKIKPKYIQFENMHLSGYKTRGENYNVLMEHLCENGYKIINENETDTLVSL